MSADTAGDAASDARFMARALRLARRGIGSTHPNPAVGCVIVRDRKIIGEGFHQRAGEPHAEVLALRAAGDAARGATVYVTLEPCAHTGRTPPCSDTLIDAGVARVVAAHEDPDPRTEGQGLERLRAAGIEVRCGLMADAARAINRGFVQRLEHGRPFVTLKLGASADGRTAMASGESQWITSAQARADVHRQRARHHAVLTSAQTVLDDNPQLNCRSGRESSRRPLRQPDRIVLDAGGRIGAEARVFSADDGAARWLLTGGSEHAPALAEAGVRVELLPLHGGHLDALEVMEHLARQGINDILVECGAGLAGALLQSGVVDRLLLYMAPCLLGHEARAMAQLPGVSTLAQRLQLEWETPRRIGPDLRLSARVVAAHAA